MLKRVEWAWSTQPILFPVSFARQERNAAYVAFFIAEYCGAPVFITHVKTGTEDEIKSHEFLAELMKFAESLKVKVRYNVVDTGKGNVKVGDIASAIVTEAEWRGCQAVIMSAQREPFFRELFGRVSDRVARATRCRVVLVETPWIGLTIPRKPSKILIPVLSDEVNPEPFILASALTSSAAVPDVELTAVRVMELPPTTPLDAIEVSYSLRAQEKHFSAWISECIQSSGRLFTPRILAVRGIGPELSRYAKDTGTDLIIMSCARPQKFKSLLSRSEYELVKKSPCIVLVVFPER